MFEQLITQFDNIFKKLRGKGKLTEEDINNALREVRIALLEADVNYKVVKEFISRVKEHALKEEVMRALTPAQQVIKIVNEQLISILGEEQTQINITSPLTIIMLVGLQGCGKTTTAAKLAYYFKKNNPLLVCSDIHRVAAAEQLKILAERINIPVYIKKDEKDATILVKEAINYAQQNNKNMLIIDTAGRLHIDEVMMQELKNMKKEINPHEIILVADAIIGQDAVNQAKVFNEELGLTGCILTKLDGDARGGAALSIKFTTGVAIKFVGVGEKLTQLEVFDAKRIASQILGMGDVLGLIEKAKEMELTEDRVKELQRKIKRGEFDFEDFKDQITQLKKMGPFSQLLEMLPGFSKIKKKIGIDEAEEEYGLKRTEAIINSMTIEERRNPDIIDGSRKRRIAKGSGTTVMEINQLLKQFYQMREVMKQLSKGKITPNIFRDLLGI